MATQNLWDAAKAVLRGKFITIPQETRKYQIDNLILHLKQLERRTKISKVSTRKEISL